MIGKFRSLVYAMSRKRWVGRNSRWGPCIRSVHSSLRIHIPVGAELSSKIVRRPLRRLLEAAVCGDAWGDRAWGLQVGAKGLWKAKAAQLFELTACRTM